MSKKIYPFLRAGKVKPGALDQYFNEPKTLGKKRMDAILDQGKIWGQHRPAKTKWNRSRAADKTTLSQLQNSLPERGEFHRRRADSLKHRRTGLRLQGTHPERPGTHHRRGVCETYNSSAASYEATVSIPTERKLLTTMRFNLRDDTVLLDRLVRFVAAALKTGDVAIVVATESHRYRLTQRLKSQDLDIDAAIKEGKYNPIDAVTTLSLFMVNGERRIGSLSRDCGWSH